MNSIYFIGEITNTSTQDFIKQFNSIDKTIPFNIYINSEGGDIAHADVIIDLINQYSELITLTAVGQISSAAFNIFFFTNCKKQVLPQTIGMCHSSWTSVYFNETGKPITEFDKLVVQEMKRAQSVNLDKLKDLGLTPTELKKVKAGKDCYFTDIRLKELLEYGKKD